ncbi:MAG: NFACT RNA binding domain-containing protein [Flammeovirgaceae bacterium]
MHNNYFFIKQLSKVLGEQLKGLEVAVCFSQNRDELIIGFCDPNTEFWMKASFQPDLCMLIFPEEFQRAKKNSIDLFHPIIGCEVLQIRQFNNERAFAIELTNNLRLVIKLFGNRANIVLFEGEVAIDLFRKRFTKDAVSSYSELDRTIGQTRADFERLGLKKCFPTFGKAILKELEQHQFEQLSSDLQWEKIQELLEYLNHPHYFIHENKGRPELTLFERENTVFESDSPIKISNEFFHRFAKVYFVEREKLKTLKWVQNRIKQTENYIHKNTKRLHQLEHGSRFEEVANIIMANLHQIDPTAEEVELHDFYRDQPIKIKLNPRQTPQKNAEKYYRKAKNQKQEVNQLKENIKVKEQALLNWMEHIEAIEKLATYKEVMKYRKDNGITPDDTDQVQSLPFKRFTFQGFEILVGKNSKGNDVLTQKYAYKEDLWLHARDVTGSHVVVKYKPKQPFPPLVIEKAASLAAYYSQGKTNKHQPVIYTPKKFVRKPKGSVAGQVVIDKEEVIMVEPKHFNEDLSR